MTRPILVLRPLEGALKTAASIKQMDMYAEIDPLFEVEGMAWDAPLVGNHDALLLTSANAVTFGGPQLAQLRSLPVLAVGAATAAAAENAGFDLAAIGESGAQALLDRDDLVQYRHILWLAGEQRTELSASPGRLSIVPVYRARALPLGDKAQSLMEQPCVILVHSRRAARQLEQQMDRLRLNRANHRIAAISPAVADALQTGWQEVAAASEPTDDALLSVASGLCVGRA